MRVSIIGLGLGGDGGVSGWGVPFPGGIIVRDSVYLAFCGQMSKS